MEQYLPKFEKVDTIPVVIHVGSGGKKTHISSADVVRSVSTGEMSWIPYRTACGSSKWTRNTGRSSENVMQYTGTAQITCQKCGVRTVVLNPKGYNLEKMRTYSVLYNELYIKNLLGALDPTRRRLAILIMRKFEPFSDIKFGGKHINLFKSAWGNTKVETPVSMLEEIHKGTRIDARVYDPEIEELVNVVINGS